MNQGFGGKQRPSLPMVYGLEWGIINNTQCHSGLKGLPVLYCGAVALFLFRSETAVYHHILLKILSPFLSQNCFIYLPISLISFLSWYYHVCEEDIFFCILLFFWLPLSSVWESSTILWCMLTRLWVSCAMRNGKSSQLAKLLGKIET